MGCHGSKATVGAVEHPSGEPATGHYWTGSNDLPSRPRQVELLLPDLHLDLTTDRGVFAGEAVDRGTRYLLLEGPDPLPSATEFLDLGCGYGPIALTLAARHPGARVWAVDVNPRARDLCRANADANGLDNVTVAAPEEVPDGIRFDACWSVQRHLGADSLARWLDEQGWATTRRASRKGYRLLDVAARPTAPETRP